MRASSRRSLAGDGSSGLTANSISLGPRGNDTFNHAKSSDCLNWPDRTPDGAAEIVDCKDDHRFEVAESVDMRTFPEASTAPTLNHRRPLASSRSARSSARRP